MATPRKTAAQIAAEASLAGSVELVGKAERSYKAVEALEQRLTEARAAAVADYDAAAEAWGGRRKLDEFGVPRPPKAWRAAAAEVAEDDEPEAPALRVVPPAEDDEPDDAAGGDSDAEDGDETAETENGDAGKRTGT